MNPHEPFFIRSHDDNFLRTPPPLTADVPLACRRYGAILSLPVSLLLGWLVTEIVEKPLGKRMRFKEPAAAP